MCSYGYYHKYTSLIEDSEYDSLARELLDHYSEWQDHQHSYLVSKDDLKAGTMYALRREEYPQVVRQAFMIWAEEKFFEEEC